MKTLLLVAAIFLALSAGLGGAEEAQPAAETTATPEEKTQVTPEAGAVATPVISALEGDMLGSKATATLMARPGSVMASRSCSSKDGNKDCFCPGGCWCTKTDCGCTGGVTGILVNPGMSAELR